MIFLISFSVIHILAVHLFFFASAQQLDYADYSPSSQFTQAMLPYNQPVPTNFPPYHYLYPGPPPVPPTNPPSQIYTLPYASYRKPPSGVDFEQKALLSKIAEESESFNSPRRKATSPANLKEQALQQILSNFVTQLPKIAESMVQIGVSGAGIGPAKDNWTSLTTASSTDQFRPIGSIEEVEEVADQTSATQPVEQPEPEVSEGGLINSMPEPTTFLYFNKLLSSFAGSGNRPNEEEENVSDRTIIRGTPILKSIDEQPEAMDKDLEQKTSSTKQPSMLMNLIRPLLSGQTKGGWTTVPNIASSTQTPSKEESERSDNLLASLIQGKFPQIDWLNAFLGPSSKGGDFGNGAREEGNALAQFFGGGKGGGAESLLFGSGLDDDLKVISSKNRS